MFLRISLLAERLSDFYIDISNNSDGSSARQCAYDPEPYGASETRVYTCSTGMYGQYVRIRFAPTKEEYLQLCEVQVFAPTSNDTDCRWTGLACTAGKPQILANLSGEIGSPTLYNVGNYPPNVKCAWEITVPEWTVSLQAWFSLTVMELYKFKPMVISLQFR